MAKPTYYGAKHNSPLHPILPPPSMLPTNAAFLKFSAHSTMPAPLIPRSSQPSASSPPNNPKAPNHHGKTRTTLKLLCHHPDATVRFTASDMLLAVESGASYLSVVKARSRAAGCFYLTNAPTTPTAALKPNGAIHVLCHIMREVLSSAAEAELGALFHNGKEACPLRIALEEMGHPQPATPMATDNNTASGIATDTVKQKQIQSNRHAFLLDSRSCPPRPVQNLLEQRPNQPCRLFF
ncbi:Reverse transcriptase (RNA-dependent DNA polymerase) [Fragilaria crotonensis]|nr:Reverse transcriptase (RNA-dependent DNA polymerase) [Fragilaria crotonensis]